MLQNEKYKINGSGLLEGGSIEYIADLVTGVVSYDGSVKVGVGFFAKTEVIPPGNYPIPPADLLSTAADTVGKSVTIGPATLTVTHVDGSVATVHVAISGLTDPKYDGDLNSPNHAALDISGLNLKLISLTAQVKYSGVSVTASLQRV